MMLVNDMIHGLYPEAITIGEDVRKSHFEMMLSLMFLFLTRCMWVLRVLFPS